MSTVDTNAVYKTLRDRILGWAGVGSLAGKSVATVGTAYGAALAGRLKPDTIPNPLVYPYGLMELVNHDSDARSLFDNAELVLTWYNRPRSVAARAVDVLVLADLTDQALTRYVVSTAGLGHLRVRGRMRSMLPQGTGEADSEVIAVRSVYRLRMVPVFLTSVTA